MEDAAKVPFMRHSVQRQRQSLLDQRRRPARRPCKNWRSPFVPDQHRHGAARGRRQGLQRGPVSVRQGGHAAGDGGDGPARLVDGDEPAAIPDSLLARSERQGRRRTAREFSRFARQEDAVTMSLHPGAAEGGGEGLPAHQTAMDGLQPIPARKSVAAPDADKGRSEGAGVDRSVEVQAAFSHWERA